MFAQETIERFLHTSYDQFASHSTVPNFLPLLAERFAGQRLQALAKAEGHVNDGKPTVLFLCVYNAGRSQMALGFFNHLAEDRAVAWFGGSEPGYERSTRPRSRPFASAASTSPAVSQAVDRRDRPRHRRRDHHGLGSRNGCDRGLVESASSRRR